MHKTTLQMHQLNWQSDRGRVEGSTDSEAYATGPQAPQLGIVRPGHAGTPLERPRAHCVCVCVEDNSVDSAGLLVGDDKWQCAPHVLHIGVGGLLGVLALTAPQTWELSTAIATRTRKRNHA